MFSEEKYWREYVTAPEVIPRPKQGSIKKYFHFYKDDQVHNWEKIWNKVCKATKKGKLGLIYYCGRSNDNNRIAVHTADPSNIDENNIILAKLSAMGIVDIYCGLIDQKNDLSNDKIDFDSVFKDIECIAFGDKYLKVLTKDEYLKNPELYRNKYYYSDLYYKLK